MVKVSKLEKKDLDGFNDVVSGIFSPDAARASHWCIYDNPCVEFNSSLVLKNESEIVGVLRDMPVKFRFGNREDIMHWRNHVGILKEYRG